MTTNATPAYGTLLKLGDGATPEVFTTIAEVGDLEAPEILLATEDATSHDSDGWEETVGTLLSGGEPSFKINWQPTDATHDETTGLLYSILNRVKKNFKIVLPNTAKTFSFSALVTGFKPLQPVKGLLQAEIKLKISGTVAVA
jgi:hypothetical protein